MLGPIFTRELITAARRSRLHVLRSAYVGVLILVVSTAWQMLTGTQQVRGVGELARFGSAVFQILIVVQLAVVGFGAAVWSALAVAHEKDRKTLVLLLTTRMTNFDLVLGKWLGGVVVVASLWMSAVPMLMLCTLLGGVGLDQVAQSQMVTAATLVLCAAAGTVLGFWREKTFQTLAMTGVVLLVWTLFWELASRMPGLFGSAATMAGVFSPWHALQAAARPLAPIDGASHTMAGPTGFCLFALVTSVFAVGLATWRVRVWATSPGVTTKVEAVEESDELVATHVKPVGQARTVWDNPILWREMRTWAYGRHVLLLRLLYVAVFALSAIAASGTIAASETSRIDVALPLAPLVLVSLLLINAQAVTAMTSERDAQTLDLLLVTQLTSREFIFGKLGGALWNAKEAVALPIVLVGVMLFVGRISVESAAYLIAGWLVLSAFAVVLGFHCGLRYVHTRLATVVSLATVVFLAVGIATTMRILVAFSGSFAFQLQPFLATMVGGSVGLYAALGARNPSPATFAAAFYCPIATFYALTSFLLGHPMAVFLAVASAYGFAVAAMLVPALYEFDAATGRAGESAES